MAGWATPLADLRTFLADTANDNLVKEKKLLGPTNGQNRTFYTFEDRLLASGNQSVMSSASALRVFLNQVEVSASGITITDQVRGELQLMTVPSGVNQKLTATYHFQQYLDTELNFALQQAANKMTIDLAANIPVGLQGAALSFAGSIAHTRAAVRWQQRKSEQFMLQEVPEKNEAESLVKFHQDEATRLQAQGYDERRSFYELRQDRGRAPAFAVLKRTPSPYTPRR